MTEIDTKLTTLETLAALLDTGAHVLIAKINGEYRIATAMQLDAQDSDADNDFPNLVFLTGLDPDGEYAIEASEAATLADVVRDAALLNGVPT